MGVSQYCTIQLDGSTSKRVEACSRISWTAVVESAKMAGIAIRTVKELAVLLDPFLEHLEFTKLFLVVLAGLEPFLEGGLLYAEPHHVIVH